MYVQSLKKRNMVNTVSWGHVLFSPGYPGSLRPEGWSHQALSLQGGWVLEARRKVQREGLQQVRMDPRQCSLSRLYGNREVEGDPRSGGD